MPAKKSATVKNKKTTKAVEKQEEQSKKPSPTAADVLAQGLYNGLVESNLTEEPTSVLYVLECTARTFIQSDGTKGFMIDNLIMRSPYPLETVYPVHQMDEIQASEQKKKQDEEEEEAKNTNYKHPVISKKKPNGKSCYPSKEGTHEKNT